GRAPLAQEFLRQRRTLVRQIRLVADDRDALGKAALAQAHGELRGGLARADDDDRTAHAAVPVGRLAATRRRWRTSHLPASAKNRVRASASATSAWRSR